MRYWFPHIPIALFVALGGLLLLRKDLGDQWLYSLPRFVSGTSPLPFDLFPALLVGGGMLTMAIGLVLRSRVAWSMTLFIVAAGLLAILFEGDLRWGVLLYYFLLLILALLASWRSFDRSSITASTLFALTSTAMLLVYATFGTYYLGSDFNPPIKDLVSALYYSMVTMSTVGYGDISPRTPEAKLFAVSIIILGISVFATSLTAIISPLVNRSLQRIVHRKDHSMKRENHFVVIGNTSLAINTWRELTKRGCFVTRILREAAAEDEHKDADIVVGDPSSLETLRQAGARRAIAVLAMLSDDSENAFVILAVKELGGKARTVAAVNDAHHLRRVKLVQPDVVIAPQVLGGELMAMLLSGEQVTPEFVMQRVFQQSAKMADEAIEDESDD